MWSGTFAGTLGGVLRFDGGTYTLDGADGGGVVQLANATLDVAGPSAIEGLSFESGLITGGGTLTLRGFTWSGGAMTGLGTTLLPAGSMSEIDAPFNSVLLRDGRLLDNRGSMTWTSGSVVTGFDARRAHREPGSPTSARGLRPATT